MFTRVRGSKLSTLGDIGGREHRAGRRGGLRRSEEGGREGARTGHRSRTVRRHGEFTDTSRGVLISISCRAFRSFLRSPFRARGAPASPPLAEGVNAAPRMSRPNYRLNFVGNVPRGVPLRLRFSGAGNGDGRRALPARRAKAASERKKVLYERKTGIFFFFFLIHLTFSCSALQLRTFLLRFVILQSNTNGRPIEFLAIQCWETTAERTRAKSLSIVVYKYRHASMASTLREKEPRARARGFCYFPTTILMPRPRRDRRAVKLCARRNARDLNWIKLRAKELTSEATFRSV